MDAVDKATEATKKELDDVQVQIDALANEIFT
jgi:hypothetical protein